MVSPTFNSSITSSTKFAVANTTAPKTIMYCGNKIYDITINICCSGVISVLKNLTNPKATDFCQNYAIDTSKYICCEGIFIRNTAGFISPSCCLDKAYDSSKYF